MPVVKGPARIIAQPEGRVLGGGMCYLAVQPGRLGGTLSRLVWVDPEQELSDQGEYRLQFMLDGRWLPIRFLRVGETGCGPVIARFEGLAPLKEEAEGTP